ncbi:MAG: hypothetical protein Q8P41_20385 [Pseudomonadota bacterium]|nr:hypothetical protein [Pseudomonadota bacterium]
MVQLTASGGCTLYVKWGAGFASHSLFVGVNDEDFAVPAGDTIQNLNVSCTGPTGNAVIDWIAVQNGPYDFAPAEDLLVDFDTMAFPGGGRMSVVRKTAAWESQGYLLAGSDVGGFAWSVDGEDWVTANGDKGEFNMGGQLAVWDLASVDGSEVYALTGSPDTDLGAGLWVTWNLGGDWTLIDDGVGANKHVDDCSSDYKSIASGQILLQDETSGGEFLYVASQAPSSRGLWVLDPDGDLCQPYDDNTLPVDLPTNAGPSYDALPSALAFHRAYEAPDSLLVGYRALSANLVSGTDRSALYTCPMLAPTWRCAASAALACDVVDDLDGQPDEVLDVRDIETHSEPMGRYYVVDGGQRWSGTNQVCTHVDSTVMVLDLTSYGAWLWDSDGTNTEPTWNVDGTGATHPYYGSDACYQTGPTTTTGDLVPPFGYATSESHELSGAVSVHNGQWLVAFYSGTAGTRSYGCVRTFRAETANHPSLAPLDWEPVQDYDYGNALVELNAAERRLFVDPKGSWLGDQALEEVWASSFYHDAIEVGGDILVAGQNLWWLPADGGATSTGFDSDRTTEDLDRIPWELAWGGIESFQDTTVNGVVTCAGCAGTGQIDRALVAVGDLGGATVFGDSLPNRTAADRDCHFSSLGLGGLAVDLWEDPLGELAPQVWQPLSRQGDEFDLDGVRALIYSEDGGQEWVWDTYSIAWRGNFMSSAFTSEYLLPCPDKDYSNAWDGAESGGDFPDHFRVDDVGQPIDVVAVSDRLALLVTARSCSDKNCVTQTGEAGLWLVEYHPDTDANPGMEYRKIENFDSYATGSCQEADFFDWHIDGEVRVHPDSDPSDTGDMRVFLSSRGLRNRSVGDCGVREVRWTLGQEYLAEWWEVEHDTYDAVSAPDGCQMDPTVTLGITISQDGEELLVWGGEMDGSYANDGEANGRTDGGGVCEIDLTSATSPPYAVRQAVDASDLAFAIRDVFPHPHIADLYFAGGVTKSACTACSTPGLYAIERRYRPMTADWEWAADMVSEDDLEHPQINNIAWGSAGEGDRTMTDIYLATSGGGLWDGLFTW